MSAQVIPFDPTARPRLTTSVEAAWQAYDDASRAYVDLLRDPASTSDERLRASIKAFRLHQIFTAAMEAM